MPHKKDSMLFFSVLVVLFLVFFFFFFQAEDGIRDVAVTGVQTCALPISERRERVVTLEDVQDLAHRDAARRGRRHRIDRVAAVGDLDGLAPFGRSEERRVGKECRCRWSGYHEKKKGEEEQLCSKVKNKNR